MTSDSFGEPMPLTNAILGALDQCKEAAVPDLILLDRWEIHRPMHLGLMLRVRQIRLANPGLVSDIEAELAVQKKTDRAASRDQARATAHRPADVRS